MLFSSTPIERKWVTVRQGDPGFQLADDFTLCNRASIEISSSCPDNVARMLRDAMFNGWIKPVAHVPTDDPTLAWETLKHGS